MKKQVIKEQITNSQGKREQSVIDEYMSKAFLWIFILIFGAITCAGIVFLSFKIAGFYADVP